MFRAKIVATFVVCMLILMVTAYASYQSVVGEAIEASTKDALHAAVQLAQQERRMEQDALVAQAQFVAQGKDLHDAIIASYEYKPGLTEEEKAEAKPRTDDEQRGERHLKVHERLTKYKIVFEQYDSDAGKGIGRIDRPMAFSGSAKPDLFFVTDAKGIGLAALGKDLFKWFDADVAKMVPLVNEVLVKQEPRVTLLNWSFDQNAKDSDKLLYQVAIVPIQPSRTDRPSGVVVLGSLLNDGVATDTKQRVAGILNTGLEKAQSDAILKKAPNIAYFQGEKIVGSTLDSEAQAAIRTQLLPLLLAPESKMFAKAELGEKTFVARALKLPRLKDEKVPAGVMVISNLDEAKLPLRDPGANTILAGVILLLVGSILILLFIQNFVKPIEKIESEIQGVVSGNRDHVFEYTGSNKLARGLAHQLNLMSAYLQGKPMPDDEDGGGNWGEMGPGGAKPKGGASQLAGVSMQDLMGQKSNPSGDS